MDEILTGRVAVVTGGSSGNGRAIFRRFADHGADVVVADVRESAQGRPTDTSPMRASTWRATSVGT